MFHACPPRYPDLTPPDFFLWGYLKGNVYINMPNSLHKLKNIIEEISRITPDIFEKVIENTVPIIRLCLNNNGEQHLKDIVRK